MHNEDTRTLSRSFFPPFSPYGWSPDSRYLAVPNEDGDEILIVDITGGEIKPLVINGPGFMVSATWSLDGKWIAYNHGESEQNETNQVFIVPAQGGEPIQLTSGPGDKVVVFWLRVP